MTDDAIRDAFLKQLYSMEEESGRGARWAPLSVAKAAGIDDPAKLRALVRALQKDDLIVMASGSGHLGLSVKGRGIVEKAGASPAPKKRAGAATYRDVLERLSAAIDRTVPASDKDGLREKVAALLAHPALEKLLSSEAS